MMRSMLLLVFVASPAACHSDSKAVDSRPARSTEVAMTRAELVHRIMNDEYGQVFYWPQHDDTLARIWAEPGGQRLLEEILADPAAPGRARFIAAEVLFTNDIGFLARIEEEEVARVYAEALAKNYVGHANPWGLLWENDSTGPAGSRFLMLGQAAIPALAALLDNDTVVDWYAGSEEATVGNGHRYRIKDFAAYYLSLITNHPLPYQPDHAARDAEIAKLQDAIRAR
jgi:hypothetical protein